MDSTSSQDRELSEKIAHFDDIFRALPDAVVMNNPQRRIVYVNEAACRMFGYAAEALIGQEPQMLYAFEQDFVRLGQIYAEFDIKPDLPPIEVTLRHVSGQTFDAEIMGAAVRGQGGRLLGFLSIIRDVTQRKATEGALRAKESQLRQIIDLVPHLIFVKDQEGRFLLVNKAQADVYGMSVEQLTGSLIHQHHLSQEEIDRFLANDRTVIASGQTKIFDEVVIHDAQGNIHLMQTTKIPYVIPGAAEPAVLGVSIDLTQQKQTEGLLRQANALLEVSRNALKNIIEQLPIGIQIFNQHGVCTDVNQAQLDIFGVKDASKVVNIYNIFEDDLADLAGTRAAAKRALAGEIVRLGDLRFDFSHADERWARTAGQRTINVIIFPILDQHKNVTHIVGLNTDVTERTMAEQSRLEVAVQKERIDVLEALISTISHDFKTPLTIIGTSLYLFEKLTSDETANKHIRRIEEQLTRLGNLINSLLTMSQLIGVSDLSFTTRDINQMVDMVYSAKKPYAEEKSISLTHDSVDAIPRVMASDELVIAVTNLVENAILFTPPGGRISISTGYRDEAIIIEIKDNGAGISAEELDQIFERFYRTDKARNTNTGGAGLGLAIAKQIVDLHHGKIEVSSTLHKGSTFSVILPTVPPHE